LLLILQKTEIVNVIDKHLPEDGSITNSRNVYYIKYTYLKQWAVYDTTPVDVK